MADRVRITNVTRHDIGLRNQTGIEYNIRPHAFITLGKDDAEYMIAIARELFDGGELRVNDEELANNLDLLKPNDPAPSDDDVIRKALSGKAAEVKKYLSAQTSPFVIDCICEVAKQMDLPASKMKLVQEAFPNKFIFE